MTAKQREAFRWWHTLSINEMKAMAKKHYPVFSDVTLYQMGATYIENIYIKQGLKYENNDLHL